MVDCRCGVDKHAFIFIYACVLCILSVPIIVCNCLNKNSLSLHFKKKGKKKGGKTTGFIFQFLTKENPYMISRS